MTEAESIDCRELTQFLHRIYSGQCHWSMRLLDWLGITWHQVCQRRLCLFACACIRRLPLVTRDPPSVAVIELCEEYADKRVGRPELLAARTVFSFKAEDFPGRSVVRCLLSAQGEQGWLTAGSLASLLVAKTKVGSKHYFVNDPSYPARLNQARQAEVAVQQHLLRDIFDTPHTGVMILPAWRTPTVLQLARIIYHDHVFYLMPVLGKALYNAGCRDEAILEHCRSEGPHARGCWAVDLVLGKK